MTNPFPSAREVAERARAIAKKHRLPWPMNEEQLWKKTKDRICPGDVTEEEFWELFQAICPDIAFFREPPLGHPVPTENRAARVELLVKRQRAGLSLWHPLDRVDGITNDGETDGVGRVGEPNLKNGREKTRYRVKRERKGSDPEPDPKALLVA